MKRVIVFWAISIGIVLLGSILQPNWSLSKNPWTANILILLTLLFFIELGSAYYRSRMEDMKHLIRDSKSRTTYYEQENHYISHNKDEVA